MKQKIFAGSLYAFVHFSVEVASFYLLYSRITTDPLWWVLALLFDALAFVPQNVLGLLTDKYPKFPIGLTGALLMLVSLFIPWNLPALVPLSLGNACIHISGAQHTLRNTGGKATPAALFVGAGSFGVITGQLWGKANLSIWFPVILLALSACIMVMLQKKDPLENQLAQFDIATDRNIGLVTVLALIGVIVRSYIAYAIPTEWNKTVHQTVFLFVSMGIGKMLGGILADLTGYRPVTLLSLLGGLPFLLFGNTNMPLCLIGVALFSMTMPVTVAILASLFPDKPGFAFGITTVGLFLGSAPVFFIQPETLFAHQAVVLILTTIALPAFYICIKRGK